MVGYDNVAHTRQRGRSLAVVSYFNQTELALISKLSKSSNTQENSSYWNIQDICYGDGCLRGVQYVLWVLLVQTREHVANTSQVFSHARIMRDVTTSDNHSVLVNITRNGISLSALLGM